LNVYYTKTNSCRSGGAFVNISRMYKLAGYWIHERYDVISASEDHVMVEVLLQQAATTLRFLGASRSHLSTTPRVNYVIDTGHLLNVTSTHLARRHRPTIHWSRASI